MTADLPTGPEALAEQVLEANRAFYEAFEAQDLPAMSDLWEHGDHVFCTHPGWARLEGWASVASSWAALFTQGAPLQFIVTGARATVRGEVAWVTCDENLLGQGAEATVAGLNVFVRGGDGAWRLVGHQGSHVAGRA